MELVLTPRQQYVSMSISACTQCSCKTANFTECYIEIPKSKGPWNLTFTVLFVSGVIIVSVGIAAIIYFFVHCWSLKKDGLENHRKQLLESIVSPRSPPIRSIHEMSTAHYNDHYDEIHPYQTVSKDHYDEIHPYQTISKSPVSRPTSGNVVLMSDDVKTTSLDAALLFGDNYTTDISSRQIRLENHETMDDTNTQPYQVYLTDHEDDTITPMADKLVGLDHDDIIEPNPSLHQAAHNDLRGMVANSNGSIVDIYVTADDFDFLDCMKDTRL